MAKREFNTESDIKNFKSKIFLYPKKLQLEMAQLVDAGSREWAIENHLKREYKGTLGVATAPTIGIWIDWYEARKKMNSEKGIVEVTSPLSMTTLEKNDIDEIADERKAILDKATSTDNKKDLLENLIRKCIERIRKLEEVQELEGSTSSLEAVLGSYVREIHSIVATQLKLSGELEKETNAAIAEMVNQNLYTLIQIVFEEIRSEAPEKADEIRNKIMTRLSEVETLSSVATDMVKEK
jgi:hypothetical protein